MSDRANVQWRLADLEAKADAGLRLLLDRPRVRALIVGILDHSSFLRLLIDIDPHRLRRILEDDPLARLEAVIADIAGGRNDTEAELMQRLRLAKQELALLVALSDLGGVWALGDVVWTLSRAADAFISAALAHLLRAAHHAGKLALPDPDRPETGSGIVVLGLGKLGGNDLNYSSDVDLVVVFDPDSPAISRKEEAKSFFVRIVRDLVRLLQQSTAHGYVLRVDLRLRPDPSSTATAISIESAFVYYESFGQNWERAAMIKARPVSGDLALGQRFIHGLEPFIWRRYFDYAAIADIHAMKRQIHAAKGHAEIAVAGHNVKLGRGGIREIEFFVQTQQLIFGGRRPDLRGAGTLAMLRQLRRDGWIGAHAVADLTRAYDLLRRVEHRLQMLADEQAHRLPSASDALERFAHFCGFASAARFSAVFTRHLRAVVHHYGLLFESAPTLGDTGGSLVFTGIGDDPETLETLARLGYRDPARIARTVREWHSGRRVAVRSQRARETLTDLVPKLLFTFSKVSDPDVAVDAFDQALQRMPAAGELFALLAANPSLRAFFGDILGSAPRLAAEVVLRPHLLDGALLPSGGICLDDDEMEERAASVLVRSQTTEEFLDAIREFRHEEHFLIGAAILSGDLDPNDAAAAYSALAVAVIRVVTRKITEAFELEHGRLLAAAHAVIAMGKLGSREMTATSDLDLVILYDFDQERPESDGPRTLHATQYFTRFAQRLISHLTVATRRGKLYEVDMRLRPSGRQGPLATKLSAFSIYQRREAATWELMALTRGRVIAGEEAFRSRVASEIDLIIRTASKPKLAEAVVTMRALIEREKPPKGRWDLKLMSGGLIDIEFIAQYLVLRHAEERPEIHARSTSEVLQRAGAFGFLGAKDAQCLVVAHRLFTNATQIIRLALGEEASPDKSGEAVQRRLSAATDVPSFECLVEDIADAGQAVREIFRGIFAAA